MSRPTLVLLPGLGDDEYLWCHQVRALQDMSDPRVIVLDRQDSLDEMATTVLDTIEGEFALAGFSMGGRAALEIVTRAPERVTHLVLVSSSARPGRLTIPAPYDGDFQDIIQTEFVGSMHPDARANDSLVSGVVAMVERRGPARLARQQSAIMASGGHLKQLASIRCPTLVVCGKQDPITPVERSTEIAATVAQARLELLERCGHYAPLERPDDLSLAMRACLNRARQP